MSIQRYSMGIITTDYDGNPVRGAVPTENGAFVTHHEHIAAIAAAKKAAYEQAAKIVEAWNKPAFIQTEVAAAIRDAKGGA